MRGSSRSVRLRSGFVYRAWFFNLVARLAVLGLVDQLGNSQRRMTSVARKTPSRDRSANLGLALSGY